jgi:hypothetical protein
VSWGSGPATSEIQRRAARAVRTSGGAGVGPACGGVCILRLLGAGAEWMGAP